ncbi:hypothetical protein GLAREA_00963 [Glarea lozoyensis ATCC 20868]|uniref:Uncharacterized protein n=1 Tax=Glarea lozoyensis (strain ATCC 20868 / MF5171) TaxID=1116229 RepID=S3DTV1_GLAL2|nr:uncharacterized protein GLAREA_00963 [Glarea lozoyensis ATCC 20868]EPE29803.1 hypothetical protein GLAREA_00963 [Glarea lozoyensis ATCC 20868]
MPPKTKVNNKPDVRMKHVPAISILIENLGFQPSARTESDAFIGAVHSWRKNYKTEKGLPGNELLQWNNPEIQHELERMAEKFVEYNLAGELAWSTERDWFEGSELEYPDDKEEIIRNLKQLFWRQNKYAEKNASYIPSLRDGGSSASSASAKAARTKTNVFSTSSNSCTDSTSITESSNITAKHKQPASTTTNGQGTSTTRPALSDIFDGPNDSNVDPTATTPSKKRGRSDDDFETSPRRTYRKRAAPSRPGFVQTEEMDDILSEPDQNVMESVEQVASCQPRPFASLEREYREAEAPCAPVAPMGIGEQSTATSHIPQLDASADEPNTRPMKLKCVAKPSSPQSSSPKTATDFGEQQWLEQTIAYFTKKDRPVTENSNSISMQYHVPYVEDDVDRSASTYGVQVRTGPSTDESEQRLRATKQPEAASPHRNSHKVTEVDQYHLQEELALENNTKLTTPMPSVEPPVSKTPIKSSPPNEPSKPSNPKSGPLRIQPWIITHSPQYTQELCSTLKFQGISLEAFTSNVTSFTQNHGILEHFKLNLQSPTSHTKLTVYQNDEASWVAAKEALAENIKKAKSEARKLGKSETLKILVEPVYREPVDLSGSTDDEDEELDF